jgi:hypothetical protein
LMLEGIATRRASALIDRAEYAEKRKLIGR